MPTKGQREEAAEEENRLFIEIGKRIRDAREQAGLTSEQLADKLDISHSNISRWENAKYKITLPTLVKIANALDVSLDELIVGAARKVEKKRPCTLRDTCEFLFKTIPRELPKTLGATYGLSDEALVSDNSSIPLTNYVFELKSRPFIYVKIPLPIALTVPSSRISMKLPTGFARLNQCGVEITRCTDSLVKLNTSGATISEEIYRDVLSRVPNIPLNSIITDAPF